MKNLDLVCYCCCAFKKVPHNIYIYVLENPYCVSGIRIFRRFPQPCVAIADVLTGGRSVCSRFELGVVTSSLLDASHSSATLSQEFSENSGLEMMCSCVQQNQLLPPSIIHNSRHDGYNHSTCLTERRTPNDIAPTNSKTSQSLVRRRTRLKAGGDFKIEEPTES